MPGCFFRVDVILSSFIHINITMFGKYGEYRYCHHLKHECWPNADKNLEDAQESFDIFHLLCCEGSPILVISKVKPRRELVFTVGEGTASQRNLVMIGKLDYSVHKLVRIGSRLALSGTTPFGMSEIINKTKTKSIIKLSMITPTIFSISTFLT